MLGSARDCSALVSLLDCPSVGSSISGLGGSMLCPAAPDGSALDGGCGGSPGGTGAA
jgi:hypothetical protein